MKKPRAGKGSGHNKTPVGGPEPARPQFTVKMPQPPPEEDFSSAGRIQEVLEDHAVTSCFICNSPGCDSLKCQAYPDEVFYCSKEHQLMHHPEGREEPFPFVVRFREGVGRYMVAARDIEPGELILTEEPAALGPSHTAPPSCLDCMRKVDGSYLCPDCHFPMCDEMCAFGDDHRSRECTIFAQLSGENRVRVTNFDEADPVYWSITVARALLLKESEPKKWDVIQRMMDHNDMHRSRPETWQLYQKHVVDFLRQRCGLKDRFSEEEVHHVLGALDVNSVQVGNRKGTDQVTGHALYPLTALLSHACICNSKTLVRTDYVVEVRATLFIPKGEEVTKQYTAPLQTTNKRRETLSRGWYFSCQCLRCCDPTENDSFFSATSCMRCRAGTILPEDPLEPDAKWKCDMCPFESPSSSIHQLVDYFESKMSGLPLEAIDKWEALLEQASKMFHPNHYVNTMIRISLNAGYIRLGHRMNVEPEKVPAEIFMRRKELLDEVQKVIEILEPGYSRRRGISLLECATCRLQLGKLLHKAGRFPLADFIQLCEAEIQSLKEVLLCLEHSPESSNEHDMHYKAQGALYEAEHTLKAMQKKQADEAAEEAQARAERIEELKVDDEASTQDLEAATIEELLM